MDVKVVISFIFFLGTLGLLFLGFYTDCMVNKHGEVSLRCPLWNLFTTTHQVTSQIQVRLSIMAQYHWWSTPCLHAPFSMCWRTQNTTSRSPNQKWKTNRCNSYKCWGLLERWLEFSCKVHKISDMLPRGLLQLFALPFKKLWW